MNNPVAPLIPPALTSPADSGLDRRSVRRLPLANPPRALRLPAGVIYGFGRIDDSGRVTDKAVTKALGWRSGDCLTMTAEAGVVVARRDPAGMITMLARPCVVIPAALRRRCGLKAGDQVLLAALPDQDVLVAYSLAVVDQAIRAAGLSPAQQGGN